MVCLRDFELHICEFNAQLMHRIFSQFLEQECITSLKLCDYIFRLLEEYLS
ncbi:MAG TPA: hypothetical protein TECP_00790 [Hyphomicrobiaceae bacterium MAG_BT-2024]